MSDSTSGSKRYLIGGGAAACAVCCAPPILALVGIAGAGTVATIATLALAGLVFALVVAAISVATFVVRKRQRDRTYTALGSSHRRGPLLDRDA
ncbi:hypothetical protein [Nocardioides sp. CER19]|uniref:hypothetical protein n=1 Tax=Nocardioides sp. CER19 TaxID=3038538 RepID=UPI00244716C8|nr:hypothetical protein [Nocardioides sp. CER19]MDH2416494.1 hypothetical protein [Nocardioides sp. CER19]